MTIADAIESRRLVVAWTIPASGRTELRLRLAQETARSHPQKTPRGAGLKYCAEVSSECYWALRFLMEATVRLSRANPSKPSAPGSGTERSTERSSPRTVSVDPARKKSPYRDETVTL